jgi:ubiquinone/menaquinone biosynthesis C-methylase UbiE
MAPEFPSLTRIAYRAREAAIRLPLVAAHLGLQPFLRPARRPSPRNLEALRSRHRELLERDVSNAEAGLYPRELLFSMPVAGYAAELPGLAREIARMVARARRRDVRDLPDDVDLSRYPDYFRRNFHWQTDGYLSPRSAALYDAGVEFLFLGTADVMRRQVIPPIELFLRAAQRPSRVLDVGAGTGRTLRLLATARPKEKYFALDLSPYYLRRAGRVLEAVEDVSFLVDNAERMPFRDGELDVVTSTFMFHELPARARATVAREMFRVLRPGGLLVIEDSAQPSESPELEVFLQNFAVSMNEPFFGDYLSSPLEALFAEQGFAIDSTVPCFLSKVVVATRPPG